MLNTLLKLVTLGPKRNINIHLPREMCNSKYSTPDPTRFECQQRDRMPRRSARNRDKKAEAAEAAAAAEAAEAAEAAAADAAALSHLQVDGGYPPSHLHVSACGSPCRLQIECCGFVDERGYTEYILRATLSAGGCGAGYGSACDGSDSGACAGGACGSNAEVTCQTLRRYTDFADLHAKVRPLRPLLHAARP